VTGCRFVHDHQAEHAVKDLCRVIELPRSTYYAWLNHEPSQRAWRTTRSWGRSKRSTPSRATPTARRASSDNCAIAVTGSGVTAWRDHGRTRAGGRARSKEVATGQAQHRLRPDLLERDFSASRPDERWVADISEFHCLDGKLFLAGIRDLFDKTLVGWAMGERQTTDLVVSALVMALSRRRPDGELVHHSDKGPQYTSLELANRLSDWGLSASFGSTGDAYDNAAMESFWATAKREIEFLHGPVRQLAKSQLRTIIFEYVEVFYNRERHQAILGHLTPAEYYATSKVA